MLSQAVRGAIDHYCAVEAHPEEVARLLRFGDEAVLLLGDNGGAAPAEAFFRASASWASFLFEREAFARAREVTQRALSRGPERHPSLRFDLTVQHAEALLALGEPEEAHRSLEALALRPWLFPQREANAIERLTRLRARAQLLLGHAEGHRALWWEALASGDFDDDRRLRALKELARSSGGWFAPLDPRRPAPDVRARVRYAAWLAHLGLSRSSAWRTSGLSRASGSAARALSSALALKNVRMRKGEEIPSPRGVLVTRAMGGLGDLLMMTPGLHALARRQGGNERVTFAIPRSFHALFAGDPAFDLADIEDPSLTPTVYGAWHDLTDCPASRVESRTAPKVTRSRIELFAEGLGVSPAELDRSGRRPRYRVRDEERTAAQREIARFRKQGKLVAVQLHCAETYRDAPQLPQVIERLSRLHDVVLIDGGRAEGFDGLRLLRCDGRPLREAVAVLGECDLLVAPDSAMVHFAAALDVRTLLLAGPISGRVRSVDYPRCEWMDAGAELGCVPCWRNGNDLCRATNSPVSACMVALSAERVLQRVEDMLL